MLGYDIAAALPGLRAQAESVMQSTVRIRRKTGTTRDSETGQNVPTWATVYEGPAKLRMGGAQPNDIDASGQRVVEQSPTVSLPVGAHPDIVSGASADVNVDDEGELLTNPHDPDRVGTTFRVAGPHDQTFSTARRLPVEVFTHA